MWLSEGGGPGHRCWDPSTKAALVQALGLGPRECTPRHSGGRLRRKGHTVLGRELAPGLFCFLFFSYSAMVLRFVSVTECSLFLLVTVIFCYTQYYTV